MEVKIKNITVNVDGQDFSFTARSVVAEKEYTPQADPEVQGKGLEEVQVVAEVPAEPVEEPQVEPPAEVPASE